MGLISGKAQGACLVPCCCQDGYRAKVPQHPIDTYIYTYQISSQNMQSIQINTQNNRLTDKQTNKNN